MKYILLILYCVSFLWSFSQTKTAMSPCDSIIQLKVDSLVRVKLDSIAAKKKKKEKEDFLDILSDKGFAIRKGFAATTKDDQQPASAFWYKDFQTQYHYTSVDLAIKHKGFEIDNKSNAKHPWSFIVAPKIEWHKNGDTSSGNKSFKNTLAGGLNLEYDYNFENWMPFFTGSADYKNDYIKKNETIDFTGYASVFSRIKGLPGSQLRTRKTEELLFRYYLYSGFEYYKNTAKTSLSSSYWASKLSFEFNPIPQYLQMTFEYTYRVKAADHLYKLGDLYWLCIGLNHYFAANKRIGIGFDYSRGNDPNNSFTKTNKIDFGVKIKV